MKINQTEIQIVRGSVLEQSAEAIVNAANTAMRGGGALDGAIHRAAGPQMMRELELLAPDGSETSEVVVTKGYNSGFKHIFHVAGPVWNPRREDECDELLSASYRNCLDAADELELETLAFPSLSTGVYAFPLERAAPIALQSALDFARENPQSRLKSIVFAMFGGPEWHVFSRALAKLQNRETDSNP